MSLGRIDEAIPVLQKAIALDPKALQARVRLIEAYVSAGRNQEAEIERERIKAPR